MDLWFNPIEELHAIGITLSDTQVNVLRWGGPVLVLQCLSAPGSNGHDPYVFPAHDAQGERVMVASIMNSEPITDVVSREWMDSKHNGYQWRYWPSYVGVIDPYAKADKIIVSPTRWEVARIWDAVPVHAIGRVAAEAVVWACNRRVDDSYWERIDFLIDLIDEYGSYEAVLLSDAGTKLNKHQVQMLDTVSTLQNVGLWNDKADFPEERLPYPRMKDLLADFPHAYQAWERLLATSQANSQRAMNSISSKHKVYYKVEEGSYSPWL